MPVYGLHFSVYDAVMPFVMKHIHSSDCLGLDLIELRERAGLTLAEAAEQTKLSPALLTALERENWEDVPDPTYSERLLRAYVSHLGGNESYYLHKYRACLANQNVKTKPEDFLPRPIKLRMKDLLVTPRLLTIGGFLIFSMLLGGYVYGQARAIRRAPPLEILSPSEGLTVDEPHVTVSGKTIAEATVTINDQSIVVQPDGSFEERLYVSRGITELIIVARKRHGEEITINRHVIYERDMPAVNDAEMETDHTL
jgi:cytoskeletal protein RodZ